MKVLNMKTTRKFIILIAAILLSSTGDAQCDKSATIDACTKKLGDGFTFLKSYGMEGKEEVEYSYVFTKNTTYMLTLCNAAGDANNLKVTLYDSNRKELASNVIQGKYIGAIGYSCNATGMYYFKFEFENGAKQCGASVLGFKR